MTDKQSDWSVAQQAGTPFDNELFGLKAAALTSTNNTDLPRLLTIEAESRRDISGKLNEMTVQERVAVATQMGILNANDRKSNPTIPKLDIEFARESDTGIEHLVGITNEVYPSALFNKEKSDVYRLPSPEGDGATDKSPFDNVPNYYGAGTTDLSKLQQYRLKLDDIEKPQPLSKEESKIEESCEKWDALMIALSPEQKAAYAAELSQISKAYLGLRDDPGSTGLDSQYADKV